MAEKTISVRLAARVDAYVAGLAKASAATTGFSKSTERNMKQVGSQMQSVGRNMSTFVTLPLVAAAAGAVKAAVDWESAWAGVTKTVDGTASQMTELEDGLRSMAKELPATHAEIAAVAEAAGALGVATEDIEFFTRTMIDLGETTNLTSDQAATGIAQMMNVMQTAGGDVDNLASALVHLGNNGASTEAEILDMATRIAASGQIVGLTEAEVLGFANALASLGIEAEAGGSAFSRVIQDMAKAVQTGGDELEIFADVAGMTTSRFVEAFNTDPAAAIASFVGGLGEIQAAGGNVFGVLDSLGLADVRVSRALLSMATSGDLLTDSLRMGEQAWAENTALADEAAKRYETAGARFEMVRNKVVDLFIDLGTMLLPVVEQVVDAVGFLAEAFQNLPAPVQMAVGGFLGLLAAMGPITFVAGGIVKNFVALRGAVQLLGNALGGGAMMMASAGVALGGLAVAAGIGFYVYRKLTQSQRETQQHTEAGTAALVRQFPAMMAAALAAERAGEEIDGVAVANEALSRSMAEGNEDLAQSLAYFNLSATDALTMVKMAAEAPVTAVDNLVRSMGLGADAADIFAQSMGEWVSTGEFISQSTLDAAAAAGVSEDQFRATTDALREFFVAATTSDADAMARAFLDAQVAAHGYEDSMVAAAEAAAQTNRQTGDAMAVFEAYGAVVAEASDAELEAAGITDEMVAAIEAVDPAALAAALGMDGVGDSADGMAEKVDASSLIVESAAERMANAARQFRDDWSSAMSDIVSDGMGLYDAKQQLWDVAIGFEDAIHKTSRALDLQSEEGRQNADALQEWAQGIADHTQEMIDSGANAVDVANDYAHNREALLDNAEAMGFNRQEVESLLREWGLMPNLVSTTYQMAGIEEGKRKAQEMIDKLGEIDPEVASEIQVLLDQGKYDEAIAMMYALENPLLVPVDIYVRSRPRIGVNNGQVTYDYGPGGRGYDRAAADGTFLNGPTRLLAGEAGKEGVYPFTRPTKMDAMVSDPRSAPLWASMARVFGGGQKAGDTKTVYVTVHNNGREITPRDISRAIREAL